VIVQSDLWLASPRSFNDPFDVSAAFLLEGTGAEKRARLRKSFNAIREGWKKRAQRIDQLMSDPKELDRKLHHVFEKNLRECGICCFTTRPRDILMWSHYAKDHSGVVLQFEPARSLEVLTAPMRVEYSDLYPTIDWVRDHFAHLRNVILRKAPAWEYEAEWRIVHPGFANSYVHFDPAGLTGAILGCRASAEAEQALRSLLEERQKLGLPRVRVYRAHKHPRNYRLVVSAA
jgi:hypothetical protein